MQALCTMAIGVFFLATPSMAQDGTASLAGRVEDIRGVGVPGTQVDLRSEKPPYQRFRAVTEDLGTFRFPALFAGEFTLVLQQAGFMRLIVKSISVSEGEQKVPPTLRIDIGYADCSFHAALDYLRLGGQQGSLAGCVRVQERAYAGSGQPIGRTKVNLICGKGTVCGAAETNSQGEFLFQNLPPGEYTIRVDHAGFYPLLQPGFQVREGLESNYFPIYLEQCPLGICDPRLRPKKPPARCE